MPVRGVLRVQRCSHGGEGHQAAEGSGGDAGDAIVVEGQQPDGAEPCEGVVVDAAEQVIPQHPGTQTQRVRGCVHTLPVQAWY